MKIPLRYYEKYKDSLLCVISDMRFPKNGDLNDTAGFDLIQHIKNDLPNLPSVLQSSDPENARYAHSAEIKFHK